MSTLLLTVKKKQFFSWCGLPSNFAYEWEMKHSFRFDWIAMFYQRFISKKCRYENNKCCRCHGNRQHLVLPLIQHNCAVSPLWIRNHWFFNRAPAKYGSPLMALQDKLTFTSNLWIVLLWCGTTDAKTHFVLWAIWWIRKYWHILILKIGVFQIRIYFFVLRYEKICDRQRAFITAAFRIEFMSYVYFL